MEWEKVPRCWPGERVHVVGGGPSLRHYDWERLRGLKVLATNAAAFLLPVGVTEWAMFGDKPFLNVFRPQLRAYVECGGKLMNITGRPLDEKNHWMHHVKRVNGRKFWGISDDPGVVSWNRSTGGCAVNVAYLMGAREIVLLGFDMSMDNGHHNWHDEYLPHYGGNPDAQQIPKPDKHHYQRHFLRPFDAIDQELSKRGVKVWNTNPHSALTQFELMDLP